MYRQILFQAEGGDEKIKTNLRKHSCELLTVIFYPAAVIIFTYLHIIILFTSRKKNIFSGYFKNKNILKKNPTAFKLEGGGGTVIKKRLFFCGFPCDVLVYINQ